MTNLARYHGRSPRYILNTEDDSLIRVAGPRQVPWEENTEIKNISLTGLAFTAPNDLCPLLGEVIKIQFVTPGSKQMACYAIVTRLDSQSEFHTLVGVHFYKLEMPQRIVLAQGLAKKFKENQERNHADSLLIGATKTISIVYLPQLTMMAILGSLWCTFMWSIFKFNYGGIYKLLLELF